MFIAHMPAGYLLTRYIQRKTGNQSRHVMWFGLIASIFPDIDLLYFFLVDRRSTEHHHYVTHLPLAWLALGATAWLVMSILKERRYLIFLGVALANLMLHMVLDSIAATIYWLAPFSNVGVDLINVTAHYDWWVWSFVLHWTFMLEILIIIIALHVGTKPCKKTY
ncbi:MAG: metal-dependent hydrolase [Pseudomonadota bacterium]